MSYDVDERTLREFMEKYYPKYKDNLTLAKILYAKHVGAIARGLPMVNTTKLKLMLGTEVQLEGVIAGVRVQPYEACVRCFRSKKSKRCQCGATESVTRYTVILTVADNYGSTIAVRWVDDPTGIDDSLVGREVLVRGIVEEDEDGAKLVGASWQFVGGVGSVEAPRSGVSEAVSEVLKVLAVAKFISESVFHNLLRERGLKFEDVKEHVEVRDGKVYPRGRADGS